MENLLEYKLVTPEETQGWPVDRKRSGEKAWAESTWGGDTAERPKLFNWNIWPCRVVFTVAAAGTVARGTAYWRRSALSIRLRGLKLLSAATREEIADARVLECTQERVVIEFRPVSGPGVYHLYYGALEQPLFAPATEWLAAATAADAQPVAATATLIEYRSRLDVVNPMEVVPLAGELAALQAAHPDAPYLVFPEDRDLPIQLRTEIPARWAVNGPRQELQLAADRNEYRVFQLGVWACGKALADLKATVTDFRGPRGVIAAERAICLTLESRTRHEYMGRPTGPYPIPQGQVRALWFGVDVPEDVEPGEYIGEVTVKPSRVAATTVKVVLKVSEQVVPEKGDHDLWRLSRLRWLESDVGLSGDLPAPFKPLNMLKKRQPRTWAHRYRLTKHGLPQQVWAGREKLLALPTTLTGWVAGNALKWRRKSWTTVEQTDERLRWEAGAHSGGVCLQVKGCLEFDGCAVFDLELSATEPRRVDDLQFVMTWRPPVAGLAAGMGYRGRRDGERAWCGAPGRLGFPPGIWMGSVEAGLGWLCESTEPWEDASRLDAATITEEKLGVVLTCRLGTHALEPGKTWRMRFVLLPTPVKPVDPRHWQFRYLHVGGDFRPGDHDTPESFLKDGCRRLDWARDLGVKRLNLHDWWGPVFNYPWQHEGPDNLARLTAEAHQRGMRVKVYNSGRELSAAAPEFWAVIDEAMRDPGEEGCHPEITKPTYQDGWADTHHPDNFPRGWPRLPPGWGNEHSVVVGCAHRYGNFYLESLRYMTRFFGTDGAYWDGAEYPYPSSNRHAGFGYVGRDGTVKPTIPYLALREMAKRTWRMLRQENPEAAIDSHHGNTLTASPFVEHLLCLPFIDSVWHGEGFDYDRFDPWAWLVEISGIPFGIPSELLGGEEFFGRAMLFGLWPRAGWCAGTEKQQRLWAFFDRFSIAEATMHGWWEPVPWARVDRPETLVTVFSHLRHGVLAVIASWHPPLAAWMGHGLDVALQLDRRRLGLPEGPLKATDVLSDEDVDVLKPVPLPDPKAGRLLWIRGA